MTPFSHSISRDRSGLWTAIGLTLLALALAVAFGLACAGCSTWIQEHTPGHGPIQKHHTQPEPGVVDPWDAK